MCRLWDVLRYLEYKKMKKESRDAHSDRKNRAVRTSFALVPLLVLAAIYDVSNNYDWK